MKVIIDMYGGDNAPKAPLLGAAMAAKELGVEIYYDKRAQELGALGAAIYAYGKRSQA